MDACLSSGWRVAGSLGAVRSVRGASGRLMDCRNMCWDEYMLGAIMGRVIKESQLLVLYNMLFGVLGDESNML